MNGTIRLGCDYNPDQWPERLWREDVALMREAGVSLATVGVFSWARLEPTEGARDWGWLDRVLDLLGEAGIGVDLATPTASPPPWLGHRHPGSLAVDADGRTMWWGSRNHFCPSSPEYRKSALALVSDLAARYGAHPAVELWHVGNELGQLCWCDASAEAFRAWLGARHGELDALNAAWGTSVWSQRYSSWDEIIPPRSAPYLPNPSQTLDFRRFCSDELVSLYRAERDLIKAASDRPVTTNLMGFFPLLDGWSVAAEVDLVATDHYVDPARPSSSDAAAHDLTRGLARGRPWVLMESAVGAVNWREHNVPKAPGALLADSLSAVARGADVVAFFQWRQTPFGAERFHSAMVGLSGELRPGVLALKQALARLDPIAGTRVRATTAILFDWPSWWAADLPGGPSTRLRALDQVHAWHAALHRRGVTIDFVGPDSPLDAYRAVLLPSAHIVEADLAQRLEAVLARGGAVVVGPFSGVADRDGHLHLGRFPAPLRALLGVSGDEWVPLPGPTRVGGFEVDTWAERLIADDAEVVHAHTPDPDPLGLAGTPAVTRRGRAWYLSVLPPPDVLADLLVDATGETPTALPAGVEAVRRGPALFLINHCGGAAEVALPAPAVDLLTGSRRDTSVVLPAHGAAVLVDPDETRSG